jgi:hypothetical protein
LNYSAVFSSSAAAAFASAATFASSSALAFASAASLVAMAWLY